MKVISEEQFLFNQLNYEDTMEIIELMKKKIYKKEQEDKKIEKIGYLNYCENPVEIILHKKIDELIDEVNKLKGEKNE